MEDLSAFGVIEPFPATITASRRMISFRSASCLSKLERVKANSIKVVKIDDKKHIAAT